MDRLLSQPMQLLALPLLTLIAFIAIASKLSTDNTLARFHDSQPCPGRKTQPFPRLRGSLRSVMGTAQQVAEGYAKYSKSGLPFLVPNIRNGPILVIPPKQLKTVLSNPERIVEVHEPQFDNISAKYTIRDPGVYPSNAEVDIVRKHIAKRYGSVAEELAEELGLAFDGNWGTSTEWKTVPAWGSLQDIAARAFNRVAFGLPLCRDETFLKRSVAYAMSVQENGPAVAILPRALKPILGPLITWKGKKDCESCIDFLEPLVRERLAEFYKRSEPSGDFIPPNDVLQWLIEESHATGNPSQMEPRRIAHRIVMLNFNSVPPAGLTVANAIFDLFSAPSSADFVSTLRAELNKVAQETPEHYWTKAAVSKLHLLDSTMRESMRISDFGSLAFPRRVAAQNGIDVSGVHVPKGAWMQIPMHNIHIDEDNYTDATQFRPFRFAGAYAPTPDAARENQSNGQPQRTLVTLDDTFLTFGYGRFGCPGRTFGAHLMKVMFAYILEHYDVEHMDTRPHVTTLMEFRFSSPSTKIRIRRRGA